MLKLLKRSQKNLSWWQKGWKLYGGGIKTSRKMYQKEENWVIPEKWQKEALFWAQPPPPPRDACYSLKGMTELCFPQARMPSCPLGPCWLTGLPLKVIFSSHLYVVSCFLSSLFCLTPFLPLFTADCMYVGDFTLGEDPHTIQRDKDNPWIPDNCIQSLFTDW